MEPIELSDFYSGGYFLIRADRPDWPPPFGEHLPDKLISLSPCICPNRLSVTWGWIPGDREAALYFGVMETKLDDFISWCQRSYPTQIEYNSVFTSILFARQFVKEFIEDTRDLYLIGIGLHQERQTIWKREVNREEGVIKRIKRRLPIEEGGLPIGFEIVSRFHYEFSHSWLCSGLDRDMNELFGLRTNASGLIDTYSDAKMVNDWIDEDDEKGSRGEPEPYDSWLFISYRLEAQSPP